MSITQAVTGVAIVVLLGVMVTLHSGDDRTAFGGDDARSKTDTVKTLRLLALGDVNLGRRLGQKLLKGDTMYPWQYVKDTLAAYDVVFANLESNLSDQHGRTEDPGSNTIFTGPPMGAASLRRGGITVVSIANNHALDFGLTALRQTHILLTEAGVAFAGTGDSLGEARRPVILNVRGMRVALFACSALMNEGKRSNWRRWVADTSTAELLPLIKATRDSVDVLVVSVHGGIEYGSAPDPALLAWARRIIEAGADIVLGHHPHVPYAIEYWKGGVIAPSLGNFVFKQPFQPWTQRSFALEVVCSRAASGVRSFSARCIPISVDYQPRFLEQGPEYNAIIQRVSNASSLHAHD